MGDAQREERVMWKPVRMMPVEGYRVLFNNGGEE